MSAGVLVVDDSITVRMDLVEALEGAGVACTPCPTLAHARAAMTSERVRLVILDVVLPDGDGVDFLRELRAREGERVCVLMLSAEAEVRDRVRGLREGADEYVGKPYDKGYVIGRVRELLATTKSAPASAPEILVIDDSRTFRERVRRELENAGYRVTLAESGEDGMRIAASIRPAAVLVDGVMPGIDGPSVIRRIRLDAALRSTPCILLTASDMKDGELVALDAGADAFVRKDHDLAILQARLAAVLRASRVPTETTTASLLGPKKILAVDDSPTFLNALGDTLRAEGYDVVLARSGEEALEMLAVQVVDCILLDVLMPGLSGHETCKQIKLSPVVREVPLIMLTSLNDREALLDGLSSGADDYIPKSSDFEVVKARVRAQLRRKQFEDENRRMRDQLLRNELEAAEARAARELYETKAALAEELERKNRELEAFSYSVSHDLRAPLRSIDGFSDVLLTDHAAELSDGARANLERVRSAAKRMGELIDDLLALSRVGRGELERRRFNLGDLAATVVDELRQREPDRAVTVVIATELTVSADRRLVHVALENLLGNAFKFTRSTPDARIEIGVEAHTDPPVYVVRDNGAGFDMSYSDKLFRPFQRLHHQRDFPGTGVGLATVHRIVDRHGGRIWAAADVGRGAAFYFTLPPPRETKP